MINRATLGYDDLQLQGERWRVYSLQTLAGVIQVAQPWRVRETLAGKAALHVGLPLLTLLPLMALAVPWIVGRSLRPLRHGVEVSSEGFEARFRLPGPGPV